MADIIYLVERLENVLTQGWRITFTTNAVIDEDALIDVIEQMHIAIPTDIRQAQQLLQQKEQFLRDAGDEAEGIVDGARQEADILVAKARADAEQLVAETDIMAEAQAKADAILAQAQQEADTIRAQAKQDAIETRAGADSYAVDVLSRIHNELNGYLRQVDNGLARLRPSSAPSPAPVSHDSPDDEDDRE